MKTSTFLTGFFLFILISFGVGTKAQKTTVLKNYNKSCTLYFWDGTPVIPASMGVEINDIIDIQSSNNRGWISLFHNDTIDIHCTWPGKYSMKIANKEILHFEVIGKDGKLTSDLPDKIILPFNFLVTVPPHQNVQIYSIQGNMVAQQKADASGYTLFKESAPYFSDKVIVCRFNQEFPQMKTFRDTRPKDVSLLRYRELNFKPLGQSVQVVRGSRGTNQNNNTVVHNIPEDAYYKIVKTMYKPNGDAQLWLLKWDAKTKKSFITKISLTGNLKNIASDLYLDEDGRPIIAIAQQNPTNYKYSTQFFVVNANGVLNKTNDDVYPYYHFKDDYFYSSQWIIPTFNGIALNKGTHQFKVTCNGSWAVPNPAYGKWNKRREELEDKKYHDPNFTLKDYNEAIKALGDRPASVGTDKQGSKSYTDIVQVVFSPEDKYLWKTLTSTAGSSKSDLNEMEIKECILSVDGDGAFDYSWIDPGPAKTAFYNNYDTEKERQQAIKQASESARKYIGFGEDVDPWGKTFKIFGDNQAVVYGWPLNIWEGPYPELRFKVRYIKGLYTSEKEALNHCKKTGRYYGKYTCYEEKIVKVCPGNYRFSIQDNRVVTDTNALFCGKSEVIIPKGHNILLVVHASGYRSETIELSKKDLEASDIHLNGKITNEKGVSLTGVKLVLQGYNLSVVSDSAGRFVIDGKAHGNQPLTETLNIKLEPIKIEITNEKLGTYKPGENFGLVSDGFTTLKLHVKVAGIRPESVVVKPPALGGFVEQSALKIPLVLDENGEGNMEYVPPAYLTNAMLNKYLKIKQNEHNQYGLSGNLWAAEVPVEFTYEDKDGNLGSFTMNIQVCRPPVMLVHGFTGDETTWKKLAVQLRHNKFDAILREYYHGVIEESTIQMQAQKLSFYIQKLREAYLKNRILQTRVDIVAHSMGGLISRYYISNMAKYGEKAGIVIPYNVKLSREQLAQMRFQKPVILIDVRKLIMVGTPNHGSSILDERLGALSAIKSNYHQIANEQLRYDSPFLNKLNAGENVGRHLSPNVQYALIYGRRRRAQLYPLDNVWYPVKTALRELADDDGVVSVNSAKLNGVVSYVFPDRFNAPYGYIHSPLLAILCTGDSSITINQPVFRKIQELLLEDIPRPPLTNASAKITRATGDASMRYFSMENWQMLSTPINYSSAVKLRYNLCHIKTGEGEVSLSFFLNGHHWAALNIEPHTIIYYEYASPEFVKVYLQQGKARFRSRKQNGGAFEVVMGDKGEKWYTFNPKARVRDMNTDFIVEAGDTLKVHSIYGKVAIGVVEENGKKVTSEEIVKNEGISIDKGGGISDNPLSDSGWWSHIDTAYLKDEVQDSILPSLPADAIHITFKDKQLDVAGFTTLRIHTDTLRGDTVIKNYRVKIKMDKKASLPFVQITNPEGITDSSGNYKTEITFREPAVGDYSSLYEIPLAASFHIQFLLPQTDTVVFESDITIPLGMTLLYGQTIGPDYYPRKQPVPPEFYGTLYQIANEADEAGNFYILFNTTLYRGNLEKMKEYAERTKQTAEKHLFDFSIRWSDSCSVALDYPLPDSVKKLLKAGQKISLGKNGFVDLLTSAEQEQRVKSLIKNFIGHMPLTKESRKRLLVRLDSLSFNYEADVQSPVYSDSLGYSNTIYVPASRKLFWQKEFRGGNPSYVGIFHALGQFMAKNLSTENQRYYAFLWDKYTEGRGTWTARAENQKTALFDKQAYLSFQEAGADFFSSLMFNFMEKADSNFARKSIYFRPGYLSQFSDSAVDLSGKIDTFAYDISVLQTKYLADYYWDSCRSNPAEVYSDFLFNRNLYSDLVENGAPASNMNEWLMAKKVFFDKKYVLKTRDPFPLAGKRNLLSTNIKFILIPTADYNNASTEINGKTISDFRQIPAIPVRGNSVVRVTGGKFLLQIPELGADYLIEMEPGSQIKTSPQASIVLFSGKFHFKAPVPVTTPLASVIPQSRDFVVIIDPKHTTISVFDGKVEVKNSRDDRIILKGESALMNKNGNIKKPKPMKDFVEPKFLAKAKSPFLFVENDRYKKEGVDIQ